MDTAFVRHNSELLGRYTTFFYLKGALPETTLLFLRLWILSGILYFHQEQRCFSLSPIQCFH